MPLLQLKSSVVPEEKPRQLLLRQLSRVLAQATGKPEQYVMVLMEPAHLLMAGQNGPAAWIEVRSIGGLDASTNRKLSASICEVIQQQLAIPPGRVYLNFVNVPADHWGWNGDTFG
jgi:phenylpyruvate tautomerase